MSIAATTSWDSESWASEKRTGILTGVAGLAKVIVHENERATMRYTRWFLHMPHASIDWQSKRPFVRCRPCWHPNSEQGELVCV